MLGLGRSGRQCQFCARTPEGFEPLAEAGTERAVVDRTANLQQQVGASARPAHLLRLVHPPIDQEIRCSLRHRRSNPQPCTISFSIIDQSGALATQIVVDLVQRMPQFSGRHASVSMTALALVLRF